MLMIKLCEVGFWTSTRNTQANCNSECKYYENITVITNFPMLSHGNSYVFYVKCGYIAIKWVGLGLG